MIRVQLVDTDPNIPDGRCAVAWLPELPAPGDVIIVEPHMWEVQDGPCLFLPHGGGCTVEVPVAYHATGLPEG